MRLRALPPVRRAVPLTTGRLADAQSMAHFFGNHRVTIFSSGTAALSHAIRACAAQSSARAPEVILPAYGCPDLVAACVNASVLPRLVDISPEGWGYCQQDLERSTTEDTVAIVAVNLLGIGDDAAVLRSFCRSRGIALIQDSAQHLPRTDTEWPGDYVVLSFGRGKPLNLLHAGALVTTDAHEDSASAATQRFPIKTRFLASRFAAASFNVLTRPVPYGILSAVPWTGLGAVVYKPLHSVFCLPDRVARGVSAAFDLYRRVPAYRRKPWEPVLSEWHQWGIEELRSINRGPEPEPVRLALLAPDRASRDVLVTALERMGLGASRLYGSELPRVSGIPQSVRAQGPFPNAKRLADRLFTLPTHSLVSADSVHEAHTIVQDWHRERTTLAKSGASGPSDH